MTLVLAWLWSNKRLVAEVIGIILVAAILYWAFVYNPKKIKALTAERDVAISQKEAAFAAINMLGEISKEHAEIDKESADNENKIRTGRRPGVRGLFIAGGVLPPVFKAYSTAAGTAPSDATGAVRP